MQSQDSKFQETLKYFDGDELRARVFLDKYALRDLQGNLIETNPEQMWRRVARELASVEDTEERRAEWEANFYSLLSDFNFIPGGRILAGAGNPRKTSLLNCYVNPVNGDTIEGIFDWMKESAKTYAYGGGVGTDISVIRPRGARVNNASLASVGATAFMDLFSLTTGTIGQLGRRGALMITIDDFHPDIFEFMTIKRNLKTVRFANISVKVSHELMVAVKEDGYFTLRYEGESCSVRRVIKARKLWNILIEGARDWAEPGLIFWDTMKSESTSEYNGMEIHTVNPCAEISLQPYGDCCLGNINLANMVKNAFTKEAEIDYWKLFVQVKFGVRFLDNVLTYNQGRHALKQHEEAALNSRRIGLGVTGLGDMLCKMGLRYDSQKARDFVDALFEDIKNRAYSESVNLATQKGSFPNFDVEEHFKSPFVNRLKFQVKDNIKKYGLRNVAILTVPPVGSGAALAGTTSGVEPIFDLSYTRRSESLNQEFFKVYHPMVGRFIRAFNLKDESELPEYFVTAHTIKAEDRVKMQATIQKHIDHAISSTVNLPRETTVEEVGDIYMKAWSEGCKGITVYREGSREGILITDEEMKRKEPKSDLKSNKKEENILQAMEYHDPRPRPKITKGRTERVETPRGPAYITINWDEIGPCEVFVKSLDAEADVTGRLVSLLLRCGVDPREVIEQLWRVHSRDICYDKSSTGVVTPITTTAQAIALTLCRSMYGDDFNPKKQYPKSSNLPDVLNDSEGETNQIVVSDPKEEEAVHIPAHSIPQGFGGVCPDCGSKLVSQNGCFTCRDCGYSKCG